MVTAKAGGESAVARALGIKVQSVQKWKKIPAERVLDRHFPQACRAEPYLRIGILEKATGLPRQFLRLACGPQQKVGVHEKYQEPTPN